VCARGSNPASAAGPSTSPLDVTVRKLWLLIPVGVLGVVVYVVARTQAEIRRLEHMCGDLRQGTPITSIRKVAAKYGFERYLDPDVFDDRNRTWVIVVGTPSTIGDVACIIRHNQVVVLSTKVERR